MYSLNNIYVYGEIGEYLFDKKMKVFKNKII
jgi:hypothetical protein